MAKRRTEIVAASLLTTWTDADTAMQIVGTSLGLFGTASLDPTVVLATETPLRNALFDVLLSLVEGGAVEMRIAGDQRYAFRWRNDVAVAGLAPDNSTSIDFAVPSPYLDELQRVQAERDAAVARAEAAEALTGTGSVEPAAARAPAAKKVPRKPPADKAPPEQRKPARARTAAKKADATAPVVADAPDVLYLTPPEAAAEAEAEPDIDLTRAEPPAGDVEPTGEGAGRPKWSGYSINRSRGHLTSVDRDGEGG
jgi:hypothetical protein